MRIALCSIYNNPTVKIQFRPISISPPLGLGYIASVLLQEGHVVKIYDDSVLDHSRIIEDIKNFEPEIVGVTAYTYTIENCLDFARIIKKMNKNIRVVFGGPHATYLPYETVTRECVDIVVCGEGEETIRELASKISRKESLQGIKGIVYKDGGNRVIDNGVRPLIENLDSIPYPAYDLFPIGKYFASPLRKFSCKKLFSIITTRGCPFECIFCSNKMFGKRIRFRTPLNVVDELEIMNRNFNIEELYFVDDTFSVDFKRVATICHLIVKRRLNIAWSCNIRADHASVELFRILRDAGCKGVFIGIESSSQDILDGAKKGITVEQIKTAVVTAKRYIDTVSCSVIFGLPGDTIHKATQSIKFVKDLNPDYVGFTIAAPVPGSELFDIACEKNLIDRNIEKWENHFCVIHGMPIIQMSKISKKDLIDLIKIANKDFYFRLGYIWSRILKTKSWIHLYHYVVGLFRLLRYQFASSGAPLKRNFKRIKT